MITINEKGNFDKFNKFLERAKEFAKLSELDKYGKEGVRLLASVTPKKTGRTANSWSYKINRSNGRVSLEFLNSNIQNGVSIAVILDTGHGTRTGGYVQGRHYIDPCLRPFFDKLAEDMWKEVTKT